MAAPVLSPVEDAFRRLFKLYRRKQPLAELSGVLDFNRLEVNGSIAKVHPAKLNQSSVSDQDTQRAGLQPISKWKAYGLEGYPGFVFISNPFLPGCQHHWVKQCLKLYPQKPNICNLDMHMTSEETSDLWGKSREQLRHKGSRKRESRSLLEKLRWVTLGYHYNWDTKRYASDHRSPFPTDLAALSEHVAAACGFSNFKAEAGILNYYHFDSSLGIHVDESELDLSQPLLSFSFGHSSIFLLGGLKREETPLPMFMHSGDIMVMSGISRLLHHAVPRIVPCPEGTALPYCLTLSLSEDFPTGSSIIDPCSEVDWETCAAYLHDSRINMTVRQVLGAGQTFPTQPNQETCTWKGCEGSPQQDSEGTGKRLKVTDSS
ncbi:nucleic acid dioxygenase ALKBH1 [Microcaecilia unicolor]|uniref:Nucleic acid dioxygenase ALKBH1 n=1 Tax=Microcaecilia unicolor TaxID=1415580 RepID=A0A6P7WN73_9AMPH|nr:nucleic acid dioxygenase ALKBH1-like [Microcaecilia unicolor]